MGIGSARGNKRAETALAEAINSPLLKDYTLDDAKGLLVNISGSPNLTMQEFDRMSDLIHPKIHDEAEVFAGLVIDEAMQDTLRVTLIAAGLRETKPSGLQSSKGKKSDLPIKQTLR